MNKKRVLVLEYTKLPKNIREFVKDWLGFHNDCLLSLTKHSEFSVKDYARGLDMILDYWNDQKATNGFVGTLQEFIVSYRLIFEQWLLSEHYDLSDVDDVLVEVCW